jgi:hypothetical protein
MAKGKLTNVFNVSSNGAKCMYPNTCCRTHTHVLVNNYSPITAPQHTQTNTHTKRNERRNRDSHECKWETNHTHTQTHIFPVYRCRQTCKCTGAIEYTQSHIPTQTHIHTHAHCGIILNCPARGTVIFAMGPGLITLACLWDGWIINNYNNVQHVAACLLLPRQQSAGLKSECTRYVPVCGDVLQRLEQDHNSV